MAKIVHLKFIIKAVTNGSLIVFEPEKEDQGDEPAKAWISRTYGDTQIYNTVAKPGQEEGQTSYGVVAWKSTVWPGAFMISSVD